jgi:mono/diheme cytochrome c family protein
MMKLRMIIIGALMIFALSACEFSLASDITPPPNYQSPTPAPTMSPLFPQSAPDLVSGAAIYAEKCAPCHGDGGMGDGPMASKLQKAPTSIGLPELARNAAPANWFTTVTEGNINSFMPPFNASLSDQQSWDVVAYALSFGGSTAVEAQSGATIFNSTCIECHGPDGNKVEGVNFADQALMAKLTQRDIVNFVDKGVGKMPGMGGLIPEEDMFAAAAYVRTFTVKQGETAAVVPSATPQPADVVATPETGATPDPTLEAGATAESTPAVPAVPVIVTGTITGKIDNGSGASVPADTKVTLHIFEHDTATQQFSEVGLKETTTAADGSYKFDSVEMLPTRAFYISVNYANTLYETDPVFPVEGETSLDFPLTIYETTTDASGLVAEQVHVLLDYSKPDVVQLIEFIIVSNPGTKAVVAAQEGGPVVKITLPSGYTNLQFDQGAIGDRYIKTDDGFADTTSVAPGAQKLQLVYAVDLPLPKAGLFGSQKLEISQPMPLKVTGLSVLVPEGVTIVGENVVAGGLQDMGTGSKFQTFTAGSFEAGQKLTFTASGSPAGATISAASSAGLSINQGILIGVGSLGVALILAGVWLYWRDRKRGDEADEDEIDDEEEEDEASLDEIMDAIVALDDQFKSGNIQEAAYKERRAELKARLKELM